MGAQAVRLSNVDIDNALKNKDFEVLFQPIFDLGNGALARVETFVRWRHPSLGVLPPGAFISFLESQGRMSELTRYVLREAIAEYRAWRGPSAPGLSVNLALSDLSDEAFASHFTVLLRDSAFPSDLITLECPMPPVTMPVAAAAEHFRRLSDTGARLAIEVRGRANDFLRTINPFPFDEIKTGGSAILRFARTVRGPGLSAISELLEIAQKANAAITAVGVEDQASLSALRGLGFAAAQGNHLGKVGALNGFSPSRVNAVRKLLGLEMLSSENLQAMFRTEAPAPQAAEQTQSAEASPVRAPAGDELVERLAARLARQSRDAEDAPAEADAAPEAESGSHSIRAAKAAAIARAKQKAVAARNAAASAGSAKEEKSHAQPFGKPDDAQAARSLQERLAREFDAFADVEDSAPADDPRAVDDFEFADESAAPPAQRLRDHPLHAEQSSAEEVGEAQQRVAQKASARPAMKSRQTQGSAQSESSVLMRTTLAVGQTRAYFRPGLRVGVVRAAAEGPSEQQKPPAKAPPPNPPPAAEAQPAPAEPDVAPAPEPAAGPAETAEKANAGATAAAGSSHAPAGKSFLARTVIPYPTHFWPRSWRRAWRRRKAARQSAAKTPATE